MVTFRSACRYDDFSLFHFLEQNKQCFNIQQVTDLIKKTYLLTENHDIVAAALDGKIVIDPKAPQPLVRTFKELLNYELENVVCVG